MNVPSKSRRRSGSNGPHRAGLSEVDQHRWIDADD